MPMRKNVETHIIAPHIDLRQPEESISFRTRLHDFLESEVHPCVATDEMAVEGLAVLELDEHGMALGGGEES